MGGGDPQHDSDGGVVGGQDDVGADGGFDLVQQLGTVDQLDDLAGLFASCVVMRLSSVLRVRGWVLPRVEAGADGGVGFGGGEAVDADVVDAGGEQQVADGGLVDQAGADELAERHRCAEQGVVAAAGSGGLDVGDLAGQGGRDVAGRPPEADWCRAVAVVAAASGRPAAVRHAVRESGRSSRAVGRGRGSRRRAVAVLGESGGWGDDVAAAAAGVDQPAELPGGVAELHIGRCLVVAVEPARRCRDGQRWRQLAAGREPQQHGVTGPDACLVPRCRDRTARLGPVGVDHQQVRGSAGDPDPVRPDGPGAADPAGIPGGTLLPGGVSVPAVRVRPVAVGRGVRRAGRLLAVGDEGEDGPAAGRVVQCGGEQLVEVRQGGHHRPASAPVELVVSVVWLGWSVWDWPAMTARAAAMCRPARQA